MLGKYISYHLKSVPFHLFQSLDLVCVLPLGAEG